MRQSALIGNAVNAVNCPGSPVAPTFRLATDRGAPISSTYRNNVTTSSTYYMQVGVRYLFN